MVLNELCINSYMFIISNNVTLEFRNSFKTLTLLGFKKLERLTKIYYHLKKNCKSGFPN